MEIGPQRRSVARRAFETILAMVLTFVLTTVGGADLERAFALPAQSCVTPPCVSPTTATTVTTMPDVTTTSTTQPGAQVLGVTTSKGKLPVTGGDILAITLIGFVLLGSGAVATFSRRRRRSRIYG